MGTSIDIAALSGPVSEASPGGEDLEQTLLLAEFESQRLFGQMSPLPGDSRREGDGAGQAKVIDWRKVRDRAFEALSRSRDLRVLPYLGAATLRLEGLGPFLEQIPVALKWLQDMPDDVYPRFDEDGIAQANAMASWADPMAIVEPLRRSTFIRHGQLGAFSLRDLDITEGKIKPAQGDAEPRPEQQFRAALESVEQTELDALAAASSAAVECLDSTVSLMRQRSGGSAIPDVGRIRDPIQRLADLAGEEISRRTGGAEAGSSESSGPGANEAGGAVGAIRSREDAVRALNAVAAYFREKEPSSAVPIFVDRAKRLIGVDFLEMISDVAPEALAQVRHVGGLRDEG